MPERLVPLPVEHLRGAPLSYIAERIAGVFVGKEMSRG
jgi:hypothetical protein